MIGRANTRRPMLGAAVTVLYGGIAIASGMDRMTVNAPSLERLVPSRFRSFADAAAAQIALTRKDYPAVEAAAARGVAEAPMNRDSVGLLASARLLTNQAEKADAAFRVSGQLGWRDLPTQLYWYGVGIDSGDYTLAAQRADAILRSNPSYVNTTALLGPIERSPEGREALVKRLAERPGWLPNYVAPRDDATDDDLDHKAKIIGRLSGAGILVGCKGINRFAFQLVDHGKRSAALRLWSDHCSRVVSPKLIFDPDFRAISAYRQSPFDWQTFNAGDVEITTMEAADGASLISTSNASSFSVPILQQNVDIPAGTYRLKLTGPDSAALDRRMSATLSCGKPDRRLREAGTAISSGLIIRSSGCPKQVVALWLDPGENPIKFSHIAIDPTE